MICAHSASPTDSDAVRGEGLEAEPGEAGDVVAAGCEGQDGGLGRAGQGRRRESV